METSQALESVLQREVTGALDYRPCEWYGCEKERHYTLGPGAGFCEEHGLEKIRQNQRKGVETKKRRETVTLCARKVLAASRELDSSTAALNKAADRKRAAAEAWRVAVRELIESGQAAIRGR